MYIGEPLRTLEDKLKSEKRFHALIKWANDRRRQYADHTPWYQVIEVIEFLKSIGVLHD